LSLPNTSSHVYVEVSSKSQGSVSGVLSISVLENPVVIAVPFSSTGVALDISDRFVICHSASSFTTKDIDIVVSSQAASHQRLYCAVPGPAELLFQAGSNKVRPAGK